MNLLVGFDGSGESALLELMVLVNLLVGVDESSESVGELMVLVNLLVELMDLVNLPW